MDIFRLVAEARALLDMELQREVWKLPSKPAERMEAYEARLDAIVARLAGYAKTYGVLSPPQASEQPQPSAAVLTAPAPAPTPAPAPAAPTAKVDQAASDLSDEFDLPAF